METLRAAEVVLDGEQERAVARELRQRPFDVVVELGVDRELVDGNAQTLAGFRSRSWARRSITLIGSIRAGRPC